VTTLSFEIIQFLHWDPPRFTPRNHTCIKSVIMIAFRATPFGTPPPTVMSMDSIPEPGLFSQQEALFDNLCYMDTIHRPIGIWHHASPYSQVCGHVRINLDFPSSPPPFPPLKPSTYTRFLLYLHIFLRSTNYFVRVANHSSVRQTDYVGGHDWKCSVRIVLIPSHTPT